jgi:hypothetical protein
MARRKKSTGADVFFDLVSRLPWWACISIAGVGYFVLHKIATSPLGPIVPGRVGETIYPALFHSLAAVGQYIVPILFVAAGIVSFIRNKSSKVTDEQSSLQQTKARPTRAVSTPAPAVTCPKCGDPMVQRSAKQGANAGNKFWGCTNYPRCKGIRAIQ